VRFGNSAQWPRADLGLGLRIDHTLLYRNGSFQLRGSGACLSIDLLFASLATRKYSLQPKRSPHYH